jgi:integrase
MTPTKRRTRGLLLRSRVWHIDKVLYGKRICESTGTNDIMEAEALLAHRVSQSRRVHLYGEPRQYTFREAATKFIAENQHKRSISRDVQALKFLDPVIGSLPLKRVHQGTLEPYIRSRRELGRSFGTINREISVVRRILNLASGYWRDETDQPWMPVAAMLPRLRHLQQREAYPLSIAEQRLLFSELEGHLKSMALFKVNTGLREGEVVSLRWEWEVWIPELAASIFVIPRERTKAERDRFVVLNRIARSVIESCRGRHPEAVFTYDGKPVTKIYNSGWKSARRRAALRYEQELGRPCPAGFRSIRVHDCKHTYGHRLRGAGVSFEDRKVLLGHKMQDVTTHYSAAEIGSLIAASERVCDLASRASPAIAVVRSHPLGGRLSDSDTDHAGKRLANKSKDTYSSKLPNSLQTAAAEFAEADGVSLDEFIAAAVAEKVGSLRAAAGRITRQPRLSTRGSRGIDEGLILDGDCSPGMGYDVAKGSLETFDPELEWYNAHNWRRPSITPPKVRKSEIIKRRSSKFPWMER